MNYTLNPSMAIWTILVLLLVSCQNGDDSKSVNNLQETEKTDTVFVNEDSTITSTDKKWHLKMFTSNKSTIRFGSGGDLSNFGSRQFYCLEINRSKDDSLIVSPFPLHRQFSPSAHERRLSVFVYDNQKFKYSYITEGYDYEKKHYQFFLSTDLLNEFSNEINIALDYYSATLIDFDPHAGALPLILFKNIPIKQCTDAFISKDKSTPKADDKWFLDMKVVSGVVEKRR